MTIIEPGGARSTLKFPVRVAKLFRLISEGGGEYEIELTKCPVSLGESESV
jgi:hypothetical protein